MEEQTLTEEEIRLLEEQEIQRQWESHQEEWYGGVYEMQDM